MSNETQEKPKLVVPEWVYEIKRKYMSENVAQFIVHGNINDFVRVERDGKPEYLRIREFINQELFRGKDIVINYDRAAGIRFKDDTRFGGESKMRHDVESTLEMLAELSGGSGTNLGRSPGDAFYALDKYFDVTLNQNTIRYLIQHLKKRIRALSGKKEEESDIDRFMSINLPEFNTKDNKSKKKYENRIQKLEAQLERPKSVALTVDYAETLISQGESLRPEEKMALVFLQKWAKDEQFLNSDMMVVVLVENLTGIDDQYVRNPYTFEINIPYPKEDDRLKFIDYFFDLNPGAREYFEMSSQVLAKNTAGLGIVHLRTIMSEAAKNKLPFTNEELTKKKKQMIESEAGGLLEFVETKFTLDDVAGHTQAKKHLRDASKALLNGRPDVMPMGYLVSGPVGTGKTFMIRSFANDVGVPMVILKNFRGMYVGQSEGNLQKVLKILKAMAPVAVMIDEADAYLGNRGDSGGSGVNNRIFSMIASFMSDTDNRGRIIWFLVTARPDLMPVDFKRQGRAEEHIGLFYPESLEDKQELLRVMLRKTGINYLDESEFDEDFFEDITIKSGADMEAALTRAKFKAASLGLDEVNLDIIVQVFNDFLPPTYPEEIELMEYSAVLECTSKELLPPRFREMDRQDVLEKVEELKLRRR
ncbi:MAG: AAA family ATPase [Bacteroidia bacterium]|nr:AAA family ATPase [Bacteroidia bacterium]